jgi:hypothetical protein
MNSALQPTFVENFDLDLLLRIDVHALTKHFEISDSDLKQELEEYFKKNQLPRMYERRYNYVRLSEIEENLEPYIRYCQDLIQKDTFNCCQLEQAIGVFSHQTLIGFLATDTGICYNTQWHFAAVEDIFHIGESDLCQINSFYGKLTGELVELLCSPSSYNIHTDSPENSLYHFNATAFKQKLESLKQKTNEVFLKINEGLSSTKPTEEIKDTIDRAFSSF